MSLFRFWVLAAIACGTFQAVFMAGSPPVEAFGSGVLVATFMTLIAAFAMPKDKRGDLRAYKGIAIATMLLTAFIAFGSHQT